MTNNNKSNIQPGDLVTLKGMKNLKDKPIGMVQKKWATDHIEIFWLNEIIANRFALSKINDMKKLEIISKADQ
tara:strand:+ start:239 stop:457 length:219 start_codon:yes stop_codon:yes gene_type:complete